MIGIVRRVNVLTVLVLLLSGLLQPLSSAQGVRCARSHAPAQGAQQPAAAAADGEMISHDQPAVAASHPHSSIPQPDEVSVLSAPCGVAALPAERDVPPPSIAARHLLPAGDPPPANLFIQSLFRPPRLS